MGVVADTFWRQPGVLRSDSRIPCRRWPPGGAHHCPAPGRDPSRHRQPGGRLRAGRAWLLGIGHPSDTTIHLAELRRGCYCRPKSVLVRRGEQIARVDYGENDHCCQNFALVAGWLDAKGSSAAAWWVMPGRLVRSRDIVETVVERLRAEETIFLHPYGVDEECDEARASIPF